MAPAVWLLYLFVALVLQTQLSVAGISFNLVIVLIYAFVLRVSFSGSSASLLFSPELKATVFGAGVGFLEDVIQDNPLGIGVLSKGLIAYVLSILYRDVFFRWTPVLGATALCLCTACDGLVMLGLTSLFTELTFNLREILLTIAIQSAVNAVLGYVIRPSVET